MFYKRQELLTFREHLSTPQILGAPEYTPVSGSTWVHPSLWWCPCCSFVYFSVLCFVFCLSSSCVLCAQCYQCLWIVCLRPVSCVLNVTSVFGLFVFVLCLVCSMLPVSLDCSFLLLSSWSMVQMVQNTVWKRSI